MPRPVRPAMLGPMGRLLLPVLAALLLVACGGTSADRRTAEDTRRRQAANERDEGPVVRAGSAPSWGGTVIERCRRVEPLMREAAVRHGVDVGLIAGIIRVESTFRPRVRSHAGAVGLMQVIPSNARRLDCGPLTDPRANIECGLTVLKRFLKHYDHDLVLGLSAYNSGFRRPNQAREASTTPSNLRYVEKVLGARARYLRTGCGR
ncbi:MAG: lytic transglycosylase domain-containing protein [Myxococcota bacterium]